jgi:hypothetical protein
VDFIREYGAVCWGFARFGKSKVWILLRNLVWFATDGLGELGPGLVWGFINYKEQL